MPADEVTAGRRVRPRVQIGEWSADPETNELSRGGEVVRIEPKAMDLLMTLAEHAGHVVGREELFRTIWPGVVVGDEALTQSIIKLRRALGDSSRSPSYIETISKRGYRLIAPVRPIELAASEVRVGPDLPRSPVRARRYGPWAVFVVIAVAVAAIATYLLQSNRVVPLVPEGIESEESRSPDWVTVTVVPIEPLGPNAEDAYLARGISEDLITDLSRLSGIRVIRQSAAGNSSPVTPGGRYRVSGSLRRESGTLRINIHLLDTTTNQQLWSERFEGPFGDLFAIQNEIIARLVDLVPAKVSDIERRRLANRYTRSLEAYDYFLRAQASFLVRQSEDNQKARALYLKALELDPKFARAYAGLAMTYAMESRLDESAATSSGLDRAFELAETARLIDPEAPQVHWALGFVHAQSRRHEQAIHSLQRAIELDRSFADAYALLGGIYTYVGLPAKSIPLLRTAMRLNPEGGYLYFLLLGRAYLFEDDIEQALINLRAASMRNPMDVETRIYLAAAMAAGGNPLGAKWEADEIRSLVPGFSARNWLETYPMTSPRQRQRLVELLAKVEL